MWRLYVLYNSKVYWIALAMIADLRTLSRLRWKGSYPASGGQLTARLSLLLLLRRPLLFSP